MRMKFDEKIWIDSTCWKERWRLLQKLESGGQGDAIKAERKSDGCIAFLKSIKAKKRIRRDGHASSVKPVSTNLMCQGCRTLIESNAHRHKEAEFEPYIASTFIEGTTLRKWREKQSHVELESALDIIRTLLSILHACHAGGRRRRSQRHQTRQHNSQEWRPVRSRITRFWAELSRATGCGFSNGELAGGR